MQRLLRAVCAALFVALPGVARAQGAQSTVQLDDPSPAGWDASGHVAWLTVDKTGIAPEWNRWYDVAAFGGSLGRFFGPHLRVEVDAATSAFAELYVTRQVAVPGQPSPIYLSEMHRYQMATVGGGASYQFFDNRWFHPIAGAGIELARERRTIEQSYFPVALPLTVAIDPPGTSSTWASHPYGAVGF
jgi:hypothetical protein